jgi:hypothetical protein
VVTDQVGELLEDRGVARVVHEDAHGLHIHNTSSHSAKPPTHEPEGIRVDGREIPHESQPSPGHTDQDNLAPIVGVPSI